MLAERKSSKSADDLTGHTACHKVVNFKAVESRCGEIIDVLITDVKVNSLRGEIAV